MYAVEQVCGLYRVEILRMQSRVLTVPGAAGRSRPMFFGTWKDMNGVEHFAGMADFLARPRIRFNWGVSALDPVGYNTLYTVPLWIETKAGKGKISADQEAFRHYVQQNGEFYISVKENFDELIAWFQAHGLREGGR